jgi:hypothetical protein
VDAEDVLGEKFVGAGNRVLAQFLFVMVWTCARGVSASATFLWRNAA